MSEKLFKQDCLWERWQDQQVNETNKISLSHFLFIFVFEDYNQLLTIAFPHS